MQQHKAGKFAVSASAPYPMWITINYDGKEICGIRHDEIKDLQFALDRLTARIRKTLGRNADELE